MIGIRSPLALLLAATLLVPAEVHVATGGCLPMLQSAAPTISAADTHHSQTPHRSSECATHHSDRSPTRGGGMQHCSAPSTCATGVALLEDRLLLRDVRIDSPTPVLFAATPSTRSTPPGTPPPRS
jgi:hypothetical protein